jgi:eukaryotic-like serine/threonine-protein kinase
MATSALLVIMEKTALTSNRLVRPLNRFLASQPFRVETGDGATVITRGGGVYKLESVLGVGGLSVVYLATRYSDGAAVAFKVPNKSASANIDAIKLLRREARILMRLSHENIVHVVEQGETSKGEPFVAMDLVRAQTLDLLMLPNGGRLPFMRAINIILQLCDALAHAHSRGIVHRDIKPGNIMVRTVGGTDKIMLFDFGIASEDGDETEVTDSGSILYASPEHLNNQICKPASDVYQVALLLFETLVGRLPFEREIFQAVLYRQGAFPLIPENDPKMNELLPVEIRELLLDSLSTEARYRTHSMNLFSHRLRRIVTKLRLTALRFSPAVESVPA